MINFVQFSAELKRFSTLTAAFLRLHILLENNYALVFLTLVGWNSSREFVWLFMLRIIDIVVVCAVVYWSWRPHRVPECVGGTRPRLRVPQPSETDQFPRQANRKTGNSRPMMSSAAELANNNIIERSFYVILQQVISGLITAINSIESAFYSCKPAVTDCRRSVSLSRVEWPMTLILLSRWMNLSQMLFLFFSSYKIHSSFVLKM